jgi:hypothetical protein
VQVPNDGDDTQNPRAIAVIFGVGVPPENGWSEFAHFLHQFGVVTRMDLVEEDVWSCPETQRSLFVFFERPENVTALLDAVRLSPSLASERFPTLRYIVACGRNVYEGARGKMKRRVFKSLERLNRAAAGATAWRADANGEEGDEEGGVRAARSIVAGGPLGSVRAGLRDRSNWRVDVDSQTSSRQAEFEVASRKSDATDFKSLGTSVLPPDAVIAPLAPTRLPFIRRALESGGGEGNAGAAADASVPTRTTPLAPVPQRRARAPDATGIGFPPGRRF